MTRRRRGLLLVGLALVLGFLAASDVGRREAALAQRLAPLVDVVVTDHDLRAGKPVPRSALAVRQVPARWAPVGAAASIDAVAGSTAAVEVPAGAYVTAADLAVPTTAAGLPVRRGERAVEVVASGSPDLVTAGARVDVLVTREGRGTSLALQDVEVLAARAAGGRDGGVGAAGAAAAGERVAATLRVTVAQAVYLTAAQSFAREIRLLPRAAGDRAVARGVDVGEGLP